MNSVSLSVRKRPVLIVINKQVEEGLAISSFKFQCYKNKSHDISSTYITSQKIIYLKYIYFWNSFESFLWVISVIKY